MKMKLKSMGLAFTLSLVALSSNAKTITFKPMNDTLPTQACYAAAKDGLSAAKALVRKADVNFSKFKVQVFCNDMSLTKFAKKYQNQNATEKKVENRAIIALIAKNDNIESKVCLDALVIGEQQAREKYNVKHESIRCNNSDIKVFVRKYQKQHFVVRNSAE